jgi:hypothetical protein
MNQEGQIIQREQTTDRDVIAAFEKLSAKGARDPAKVDENDSDAIEANRLMEEWAAENPEIAGTSLREMLLVKAGFTDPDYIDEVANDRLLQDLRSAEKNGDTKLTSMIQAAINVLNEKINNNN